MGSEKDCVKLVMFPWLAHGHISPFLELAKILSHRNFHIHLCSTPINLSSIKDKISKEYSHKIQLVELHLPSLPELPPHYHTTNGLPLHLNPVLLKAIKMGKSNFSDILLNLQPDLLIHDLMVPWAAAVGSRLSIPTVTFTVTGAANKAYLCHLAKQPEKEFPFPEIELTGFGLSKVLENIKLAHNYMRDTDDELPTDTIMLMNSWRHMDGKYIDYLSKLMSWNIVPTGALVQAPIIDLGGDDDEVVEWLQGKDEFSTVYVSFGSEYCLGKEDIEEIAYGLEQSNVNFIWVIRFPKGEDTRAKDVLPQGFLERVGERGRIVEKWAPQAKILSHSSICGFVSHCGWNSVMESIHFGVPIIGMPMQFDQHVHAKWVADLGVSIEVKRDAEEKFRREGISRAIQDVVLEEKGKELRTKIGELRESNRSSTLEGIHVVVQKLREVCGKNDKDM